MDWGDRGIAGVLQKHDGGLIKYRHRWVDKWVTCDGNELCYYNGASGRFFRQVVDGKLSYGIYSRGARKSFPLVDIAVRLFDKRSVIQVYHIPCVATARSYNTQHPYKCTLRCDDRAQYVAWARYFERMVVDVEREDLKSNVIQKDPPRPTKRGVLCKLEGHRNAFSPRALSVRWTRKWVVCDHRQLSYYSSSAEPPAKQKPRKTIPLKDCAVRFYQDMLLIEFNHWPAAGMGKNGGSGGGGGGGFGEDEEDDDDDEEDRLYTLTFRCVDVKEFGDWSRFIRGAKYHTPRQKIPSHPVLRSLVAISHRVPAPALIVLTFVATKSLVSWRNRHTSHEQSRRLRALPDPTTTHQFFYLSDILWCAALVGTVIAWLRYAQPFRRRVVESIPRDPVSDGGGNGRGVSGGGGGGGGKRPPELPSRRNARHRRRSNPRVEMAVEQQEQEQQQWDRPRALQRQRSSSSSSSSLSTMERSPSAAAAQVAGSSPQQGQGGGGVESHPPPRLPGGPPPARWVTRTWSTSPKNSEGRNQQGAGDFDYFEGGL